MSLRSAPQTSKNFPPFEVLLSKEMRDCEFVDCHLNDTKRKYGNINSYVLELTRNLASIHRAVKKNIQIKAKEMEGKQKFLRKELNVDSFVMVKIPPVKMSPLGTRFNGPYKIIKVIGQYVYDLQDSKGKIIQRHRDQIKPIIVQEKIEENVTVSQPSTSSTQDEDFQLDTLRRTHRQRQPVHRYGMNS